MRKTRLLLASMALAALAAPAFASGDAEEGEKVFKKCKTCHMVGPAAKSRTGPALNGIIDAPAGVAEDFKYSDALLAMKEGGLVWTVENLDAYLLKPKDFMPGTKMSFGGLRKEDDREDVIAYLATFAAE